MLVPKDFKMIKFTLFSSIYDNITKNQIEFDSFEKFDYALKSFSTIPGYKPKKGEWVKKSTALISPALYKPGTTRSNDTAIAFGGFAMLDVDDFRFGNGDSLEYELCSSYPDVKFICYSTSSSTFEHPKFRLVFPLDRFVEQNELLKLIYAINQKFGDMSDPQTKDISRMFYLPAIYPDSYSFYFSYDGNNKSLCVNTLFEEYPYKGSLVSKTSRSFMDSLSPAFKDVILNNRKGKIESNKKDYSWTSYINCPFLNQNLVNEYKTIAFTDGSGRYSMIYKIMCSIASNAIKNRYPITDYELVEIIRELDKDTSRRYQHRKLDVEANRAITWAYKNSF
jgi:hypothetical protein